MSKADSLIFRYYSIIKYCLIRTTTSAMNVQVFKFVKINYLNLNSNFIVRQVRIMIIILLVCIEFFQKGVQYT